MDTPVNARRLRIDRFEFMVDPNVSMTIADAIRLAGKNPDETFLYQKQDRPGHDIWCGSRMHATLNLWEDWPYFTAPRIINASLAEEAK